MERKGVVFEAGNRVAHLPSASLSTFEAPTLYHASSLHVDPRSCAQPAFAPRDILTDLEQLSSAGGHRGKQDSAV